MKPEILKELETHRDGELKERKEKRRLEQEEEDKKKKEKDEQYRKEEEKKRLEKEEEAKKAAQTNGEASASEGGNLSLTLQSMCIYYPSWRTDTPVYTVVY